MDNVDFNSVAFKHGEIQNFSFNGEGVSVIAFFPGAFTEVCTKEMCSFRDMMSDFNDLDVEVIGVSVDSPFSLKEFAHQNNLDFTLVSDTSRKIIEQFNVKISIPGLNYEVADRSVFITKNGEIVYEERIEDPSKLPDIDKLGNKLNSLIEQT